MQDTHRHSDPHRSGRAESHAQERRRGALAIGYSDNPEKAVPRARSQRSGRHHAAPAAGKQTGLKSATQCALFACLGLATVLVAEVISKASHVPSPPTLNLLAAAFVVAAFGTGVYAQTAQRRHWSRRVRQRLLVGLPIAACSAVAIIANTRERHAPSATSVTAAPPAAAAAKSTPPEDDALLTPGWYGEARSEGVVIVVTSFDADAREARRFNRGLLKPVAYATLSLINAGSPTPVALTSFQASLLLDTGETVQSLAIPELLARGAGQRAEIRNRLAEPQQVAFGAMIPDIPICMEAGFSWSRVTSVSVRLGSRTLIVTGRLTTAEEKLDLLKKSQPDTRPAAPSRAAEDWYKNL